MGEGAKKKCAAAARAVKKAKMTAAKAKTPVEAPASASTDHTPSDTPTQSNARNSKKTVTAPRVPSAPSNAQPVPTRQSTRLLSSSSTLRSDKKHISANDGRTRPLRTATATAMALLQELHFGETEEVEHDPEGVFVDNDEVEEEDEDGGSGDDEDDEDDEDGGTDGDEGDNNGSDTGIEVIEGPVAHKGPSKVPAVRKKQKLQAIDEESSSDEFGEYFLLN